MEKGKSVSEIFSQSSPEIMNQWEDRTKKEVSATYGQSSLILRNALPNLLAAIATLLSNSKISLEQVAIDAAETMRISKEHGRGRAGIPVYLMSQVITEYHILRECIFNALSEKTALSQKEQNIIISTIEDAVNVAATEFVLTLNEIQDQFMLSIAHDLRTPIASIQAGVQLIQRFPKAEFTSTLSERLGKQIKQMTDMVELILDTNHLNAGYKLRIPLSECDLDIIVRDIVEDMKLVHGDYFILASKGPVIGVWNPEYLRRLLENLVNNAVKYRSPETSITITIQQTEKDTMIDVNNQGEPISPSEQAQLFTTFRRLKRTADQKGWGLGLPLVKGIAETLNGSVRVKSSAEKGTSFIVVLPNKAQASEPVRKAG